MVKLHYIYPACMDGVRILCRGLRGPSGHFRWFHCPVIQPQQQRGQQPYCSNDPPHAGGLVRDLAIMVEELPGNGSRNERSDTNRQKCESQVSALLVRRGETRDVFVIAG